MQFKGISIVILGCYYFGWLAQLVVERVGLQLTKSAEITILDFKGMSRQQSSSRSDRANTFQQKTGPCCRSPDQSRPVDTAFPGFTEAPVRTSGTKPEVILKRLTEF